MYFLKFLVETSIRQDVLRLKGNAVVIEVEYTAYTYAQKTTRTRWVYTKSIVETEERGRRRNGVVYTYLACKHSRGLPEEQQVPTDTTAESSSLALHLACTQSTYQESRRCTRTQTEYLK